MGFQTPWDSMGLTPWDHRMGSGAIGGTDPNQALTPIRPIRPDPEALTPIRPGGTDPNRDRPQSGPGPPGRSGSEAFGAH